MCDLWLSVGGREGDHDVCQGQHNSCVANRLSVRKGPAVEVCKEMCMDDEAQHVAYEVG